MIRQFQSEFKIRKFHLKLYLAVLAKTERASGTHQAHFAETRLNVLRAGTFLILYNLVEASARNAEIGRAHV